MARVALLAAAVVLAFLAATEVAAKRWTVGDNKFWNPNINYTIWAQDKHFYLDDWLYFVYERNQYNVIEVNETNYMSCNSNNPIANWSRGAGRDLVPLNVTRHYYLISGNGGGCYGGMKLAVLVEKPPPPPAASPIENDARRTLTVSGFANQFVIPVLVFAAVGTMWDTVLRTALVVTSLDFLLGSRIFSYSALDVGWVLCFMLLLFVVGKINC